MKFTCTLLLMILLVGICYGQQKEQTYTDHLIGAPIKTFVDHFETQTGYAVSGKLKGLFVTIDCYKCSINTALDRALHPIHCKWKGYGKLISVTQADTLIDKVSGIVLNSWNKPYPNVNVTSAETNKTVRTNEKGEFVIHDIYTNDKLQVSHVNASDVFITVRGADIGKIILSNRIGSLPDFTFTGYSNGYTTINLPNVTGSGSSIGVSAINNGNRTLTEVLGKGRGGVLVQNNKLSLRGVNTIITNAQPLIILNDFPYDGDINNIVPDEIESITVLKDAAATAIWGVRAGNGVIVIKTKKGNYSQTRQTEFGSDLFFTPKPDLFKNPNYLTSDNFIGVEKFLFDHGYYDDALHNIYSPVSPVAQILYDRQQGYITTDRADAILDSLKNNDVRKDLRKYFYQNDILQRYTLNTTEGNNVNNYHLFLGYDHGSTGRTQNEQQHFVLNFSNQHVWLKRRLQLFASARISFNKDINNNIADPYEIYPYSRLTNDAGIALPVTKDHKDSYPATADAANLLDWKYRPVDEISMANNKTNILELISNYALEYKFNNNLTGKVIYQLEKKTTENNDLKSVQTYYTRNLINEYTQINGSAISYGVPMGGILDKGRSFYRADNVGFRLQYLKIWDTINKPGQQIDILTGLETKIINTQSSLKRLYGYNDDVQSSIEPNYLIEYPQFGQAGTKKVPFINRFYGTNENYISGYITGVYNYQHQLAISGSLRQDGANTFAYEISKRFSPLWSVGLGWEISRAKFYRLKLPYLKFRFSHGLNGNVYKLASSETILQYSTDITTSRLVAAVAGLKNPDLGWEKNRITNFGIDLATNKNRVIFTADYYIRDNTNLFADTRTDRSYGIRNLIRNSASTTGKGFELGLTVHNDIGAFGLSTTFWLNHAVSKIKDYHGSSIAIGEYCLQDNPKPLKGHPLNSIFSVKTRGLNGGTGQLIGVNKGVESFDYNAILQSTDLSSLTWHGSSVPTYYGTFGNTFRWKDLSLSVNISYKYGYYFRRTSINYNDLFENHIGHIDYMKRWQHSGDEKTTTVPAMMYPSNVSEDTYYSLSGNLVEPGDHIRLQEIRLMYKAGKSTCRWLPFDNVILNAAVNNLGILWRANNYGIDPDYNNGVTSVPTFLFGFRINFN